MKILKDYASKSWSGIITDFYVPRWQMLFDDVKNEKERFDEKSIQNKIREMEEKWTESPTVPTNSKALTKMEYIDLVSKIVGQSL